MMEFKLLLNSVISNAHKNSRFMSLDIEDFFLVTPMDTYKYMKINVDILPRNAMERYSLYEKICED